MRYYLVRHTKPDVPDSICYGQTDVDVLPSFEREKDDILKKLGKIEFDRIYSSPLKRCARLAKSIDLPGCQIIFDNRLMELDFGAWEMKPWTEIENSCVAKRWFEDYINSPTPYGESYMDLLERVRHFIIDIQDEKDITSQLIICHRGIMGAFYTIINNLDPGRAFDLKIDFGSVVELEQNGRL
ncbi:MAG: alpha-ribazole phosphatase family protein [Bacteroidales bacterium]|nr:alpha-ribazole phosphatase family protein [Bacteroidales bacterium]